MAIAQKQTKIAESNAIRNFDVLFNASSLAHKNNTDNSQTKQKTKHHSLKEKSTKAPRTSCGECSSNESLWTQLKTVFLFCQNTMVAEKKNNSLYAIFQVKQSGFSVQVLKSYFSA